MKNNEVKNNRNKMIINNYDQAIELCNGEHHVTAVYRYGTVILCVFERKMASRQ